jgi:hypothetical protein
MVIGRLAGRRRGAPASSNPSSTCGAASSGSTLPTGWSNCNLPCSTSCIAATEVTALVIDASRKIVSSVISRAFGEIARAERALVEDPLVGSRHRDDARHLLGLGGAAEDGVDLRVRRRTGLGLRGCAPGDRSNRSGGGEGRCGFEHLTAALLCAVHRLSSRRVFNAS